MALRVRWSPRAADDLEAIAEYISLDSPAYAKSVIKTILEITRKFSQFPLAGRIVPEFNDENIREWFAYSYRIIYRLDQNIVRRMLTMEDK
jgi:plasmid stabilization system protein ParE